MEMPGTGSIEPMERIRFADDVPFSIEGPIVNDLAADITVHESSLKVGINRNPEFERKGLASFAVLCSMHLI